MKSGGHGLKKFSCHIFRNFCPNGLKCFFKLGYVADTVFQQFFIDYRPYIFYYVQVGAPSWPWNQFNMFFLEIFGGFSWRMGTSVIEWLSFAPNWNPQIDPQKKSPFGYQNKPKLFYPPQLGILIWGFFFLGIIFIIKYTMYAVSQ